MKAYIGTKYILAKPMTRGAYNTFRGWETPSNEDPLDEGFLVEYINGGKPNNPWHKGYISWSPADVFARAYRETSGLTFGVAIEAMRLGARVTRAGWNGKGMWLALVPEKLADAVSFQYAALKPAPWIGMKTADDKFVPWLASQTDMLAEDWEVIPLATED